MYDAFMIATLPILWIALNVTSFITILLHEVCHGIPALLFTKRPVTIYIGIYGDDSSPKFTLGRLTIYTRPKFSYLKNRGLCLYDTGITFNKQLTILLGGPVIILVLTILLFNWLFFGDADIYIKALLGCALASAVINLVVNLFPKKIQVANNRRLHYSDGYHLILMFEDRANYSSIMAACKYFDEGDYGNALQYLNKVDDWYMDESIFGMLLTCYVQLNSYTLAIKLNNKFSNAKWYDQLSADDYNNLASADIKLKNYEAALKSLNTSVILATENFTGLYQLGLVQNILGHYAEAKTNLHKAIYIDQASPAAYSMLAFANLNLGLPGEALIHIEQALALDENNAYGYLCMGMYLLHRGKPLPAQDNLKKAKKLDSMMLFVDDYLMQETKEKPAALKLAPAKSAKKEK